MGTEIRTILLVDDDADLRFVGELALGDVGGWEVRSACDGAEALSLLQEQVPDVVLLDMMMPGLDGLQTLARIRAMGLDALPVIMLTAKVQTHEVAMYLEAGAVGVIAKPFDPMTLAAEVQVICHGT